jgi:hypothetical protein
VILSSWEAPQSPRFNLSQPLQDRDHPTPRIAPPSIAVARGFAPVTFGGHQNAQFNDAIATIKTPDLKAVPIAILDGVLYIRNKSKMYMNITTRYADDNIMSALVLREFLYQL